MHGLIFVTWEKYLGERFGTHLLNRYRAALEETPLHTPVASHVYSDETLLTGVGMASTLTAQPAEVLLREYGRYFILNSLTSHLCAYLLRKVHTSRELLLMMRQAHAQMRLTPEALTPPLFEYAAHPTDPQGLTLIYDSPRQLCSVLVGAIEGAAQRFGEEVEVVERTCMRKGASACRFEIRFMPPAQPVQDIPETTQRHQAQQHLANQVLAALPRDEYTSCTLMELHHALKPMLNHPRLSVLLEAIYHLQYAGLVASTASQPGDNLTNRRYWRAPTV
ncbi:MAG TPA: heme NO-binding domain-containing protein [Ktedonobacteraceae bacterium]|jgi:hypothetical protein|nr:heme NO-binding domain-containing protein [Ktedonobacteraceae bacterium]